MTGERLRQWVLKMLRVPPEPAPPSGAPGSLRVFRAGNNFWRLRLVAWGGKQLAAMAGILFSVYFIDQVEQTQSSAPTELRSELERKVFSKLDRVAPRVVARIARKVPLDLVTWLRVAEGFAIAGFCIQFPLTLAAARLDYTYRWYMVTDRSLRLRWGLATVHEATMSFANVQQVKVSQGPLQRLLGLADVEVESAGGGGGGEDSGKAADHESMHRGVFRGVEQAEEIRDLILARLRRFRETGLGDPDDARAPVGLTAGAEDGPPALPGDSAEEAAKTLLAEVRALRATLRAEG